MFWEFGGSRAGGVAHQFSIVLEVLQILHNHEADDFNDCFTVEQGDRIKDVRAQIAQATNRVSKTLRLSLGGKEG